MTVLTVLAVVAVLVMTATPLKLNPFFRHPEQQRGVENSGEGKTCHKPLPKSGFGPPDL